MGISGSRININEYSDGCYLPIVTNKVNGLSSNSSSPTDTWVIDTKQGVYYDNERVNKIFLKYFIDPYSLPPQLQNNQMALYKDIQGLRYEVSMYRDVIRPLIDYKISPHFVKYYGSGYSCNKSNMINTLIEGGFSQEDAKNGLKNNTLYIGNRWKERPAIQKNAKKDPVWFTDPEIFYNKKSDIDVNYTLLMNEVIPQNAITYSDLFMNNSNTDLFRFLYPVFYSCYCMCLSKANHNDLHFGNIYVIPRASSKVIRYDVEDFDPVYIKSSYDIKIYDFDRSYCEKLGMNIGNTNKYKEETGSRNTFVPVKDFYKVLMMYALFTNNTNSYNVLLDLLCGKKQRLRLQVRNLLSDRNFVYYKFGGKYIGDDFLNSLRSPKEIMKDLADFNDNKNITSYDEKYTVKSEMFEADGKLKLDVKDLSLEKEVKDLRDEVKEWRRRDREQTDNYQLLVPDSPTE